MAVSKIRIQLLDDDSNVDVFNLWNESVMVLINDVPVRPMGVDPEDGITGLSLLQGDIIEINDSLNEGVTFNSWSGSGDSIVNLSVEVDILEFPSMSAFTVIQNNKIKLQDDAFTDMFYSIKVHSFPSGAFDTSSIQVMGQRCFYETFKGSSGFDYSIAFPANSFRFDDLESIGDNAFRFMFMNSGDHNIPSGFNFPKLSSIGKYNFNAMFLNSKITVLPNGSFSFPALVLNGTNWQPFQQMFQSSSLIRFPDNSFSFPMVTSLPMNFCSGFITGDSNLVSLGEGTFSFGTLTSMNYGFFNSFVQNCPNVTKLPHGSFNIGNASASGSMFSDFGKNSGLLAGQGVEIKNNSSTATTVWYNNNGVSTSVQLQQGESFSYAESEIPNTITITSSQQGYVRLRNMWDSPIYINDVLYQSHGGTQADSQDYYEIAINPSSPIVIKESVAGSTFKQWCVSSIGLVTQKPQSAVNQVQITQMPTMDKFINGTVAPAYTFQAFNRYGLITSLPSGSFDTYGITNLGIASFSSFNDNGKLSSLPVGSFNTSTIVNASNAAFSQFNQSGQYLTALPSGSFNFASLEYVGNDFCNAFNYGGYLASLPEYSFSFGSLIEVGNYFFAYFNMNGYIEALPYGSFNISSLNSYGTYTYTSFNSRGNLLYSTTAGVGIKNFTSSNITFHYMLQGNEVTETVASGDTFEYYMSEYNPQPPAMKVYVGSSRVTDIYVGADKVTDFFA